MPYNSFFFKQDGEPRLAVITGKKVGPSTVRNKIRRRIKAIAFSVWKNLQSGVDLIVVARTPSAGVKFQQLRQEFLDLVRKGHLIDDKKVGTLDD